VVPFYQRNNRGWPIIQEKKNIKSIGNGLLVYWNRKLQNHYLLIQLIDGSMEKIKCFINICLWIQMIWLRLSNNPWNIYTWLLFFYYFIQLFKVKVFLMNKWNLQFDLFKYFTTKEKGQLENLRLFIHGNSIEILVWNLQR
jgi:hypothetical protein